MSCYKFLPGRDIAEAVHVVLAPTQVLQSNGHMNGFKSPEKSEHVKT